MPRSPAELAKRATEVLRRDGISGVASMSLGWIRRVLYQSADYLLFEHDLRPTDYTPRAANVAVTTLCSPGDLDRIPEAARNAMDPTGRRIAAHLTTGGMIFCVVIGEKLAHQLWVGTRPSMLVDPIGAFLDYEGAAYLGAGETAPEFRGQGILPLVLCRICDTLRSRGFARALATVSPDNSSSIRGITKAGFTPAGRGTLIRRLGRYSWKPERSDGREGR